MSDQRDTRVTDCLDRRDGVVGRAVVDDDDFEVLTRLRQHAVDGTADSHRTVVNGDDDADLRAAFD